MMVELEVRLLGTPQVHLRGVRPSFLRRSSEALFYYLVATRRPHSRDWLATLLAGETEEARARRHLRNALADLTAQLGDYVLVNRHTVAFNTELPYWLDIDRFESALSTGSDRNGYDDLHEGSALYQGEFLFGFDLRDAPEFDEWCFAERERLKEKLAQALHSLTEYHSRRGDVAAGVESARRLLTLEPWREEAYRQLMLLLARNGQRSAALAQYEACKRILATELGTQPMPETTALYERLRAEEPRLPHNIEPVSTRLVGRQTEMQLITERLSDPTCRLLTLVGLGGSGKTRLALEVANQYVDLARKGVSSDFPDGVFFVALPYQPATRKKHEVACQELILQSLASALGTSSRSAPEAWSQLRNGLRGKSMLLILDQAEQALDGIALLGELLSWSAGIKILATSRMRLALEAEWVLEVGGLQLPEGPFDVDQSEAGQLFLFHAQQACAAFVLTDGDRAQVARVCHLVGGHPLALQLAASWVSGMPCAVIGDELSRNLDLLTTPHGSARERHRSVRALLSESFRLLTPGQRDLVMRLSVFKGGFTRQAACEALGTSAKDIAALIESSIASSTVDGRCVLHPLIGQHAAEQLAHHPFLEMSAAERHATYFAQLLEKHAWGLDSTGDVRQIIWTEWANLQAARRWATEHSRTDLVGRIRDVLQGAGDQPFEWMETADALEVSVDDRRAEELKALDWPRNGAVNGPYPSRTDQQVIPRSSHRATVQAAKPLRPASSPLSGGLRRF